MSNQTDKQLRTRLDTAARPVPPHRRRPSTPWLRAAHECRRVSVRKSRRGREGQRGEGGGGGEGRGEGVAKTVRFVSAVWWERAERGRRVPPRRPGRCSARLSTPRITRRRAWEGCGLQVPACNAVSSRSRGEWSIATKECNGALN